MTYKVLERALENALDKLAEKDFNEEVKCEVCGYGLGRTERYGRNICERCEEKLLG